MTDGISSYNFNRQYLQGEQGATFLDRYFSRWFEIERVDAKVQREGIDRYFTTRDHKRRLAVEYKTDETASRTGNAFIETISVDTSDKPGWIYTSKADYLFYYLPTRAVIYMLNMDLLRQRLSNWQAHYPVRKIPNTGYHTHGLLVPLSELEKFAEGIFNAQDIPDS